MAFTVQSRDGFTLEFEKEPSEESIQEALGIARRDRNNQEDRGPVGNVLREASRPGAAVRAGIRAIGSDRSVNQEATRAFQDPESEITFTESFRNKDLPFVAARLAEIIPDWNKISAEDQSKILFAATLPTDIKGLVADTVTDPVVMLSGVLAGKAFGVLGKIPFGTRTLGQRSTGPISKFFAPKHALDATGKAVAKPIIVKTDVSEVSGAKTPATIRQKPVTGPSPIAPATARSLLKDVNKTTIPENPRPPAGNINIERLDPTLEAEAVIRATARKFDRNIDVQKRNTITLEETRKMADELGMKAGDLFKRKPGDIFNAEELTAARTILRAEAEKAGQIAAKIRENASQGIRSDRDLLAFRLQLERHADVQRAVSGISSEIGRALGAGRIKIRNVPDDAVAIEQILKQAGGRGITQDLANKMAEIDLKNPLAVNKFIRGAVKAKTSDKIFWVFINSILSGPKTHVVNVTSNATFSALSIPKRLAAGIINLPAGKQRQVLLGEALAETLGKVAGIKEGIRRAFFTLKEGFTPEQATKIELKFRQPIRGVKGEILGAPTKLLVAEDEFFKGIASVGETYALAYRQAAKEGLRGPKLFGKIAEIINNPSEEIINKAILASRVQTFQKDLGKLGNFIITTRDTVPGLRYFTPFIRTLTNIIKQAVEFSPAGFIVAARRTGEEKVMTQGSALVGSAISGYFALQAMEGKITGPPPSNPNDRAQFFDEGKQPFSILINGQWIDYSRIEPLATTIGVIAIGHQMFQEGKLESKDAMEVAGTAATNIGQMISNKTFFRGLSDLVNVLEDPAANAERTAANLTGGILFPASLMRSITQAIDPYLRDPEGFIERLKVGIPEASKSVQPKLDRFGNPIRRFEDDSSFIERLISPFKRSRVTNDPVVNELGRLGVRFGSQGIRQRGIKLSREELFELRLTTGTALHKVMDAVINTKKYRSSDDLSREKQLNGVITGARTWGVDQIEMKSKMRVFADVLERVDKIPTKEARRQFILDIRREGIASEDILTEIVKLVL